MKIISFMENTTENDSLYAEHGLSLYIETEEHKILFDMGQTEKFAENAERLGVNLEEIDIAVLSHGHYDHGGGLRRFLEINQTAPVYVHKDAFGDYYNGTQKYIGLDKTLQGSNRIVYVDETKEIREGLTLYACNELEQKYHLGSFGLTKKQGDAFLPDDFQHEQYLLIEESGKKVLVSGCSHKGILNIAEWFQPDVLIGGFHFSKLPLDETLKGYAAILDGLQTEYYTCHCTGMQQYEFMKQYMKNLYYLSCGKELVK